MNYQSDVYGPRLQEGQRYQRLVESKLRKYGFILGDCRSKEEQYEIGENRFGMEIKLDLQLEKTGNVYIETHEKSDPDNPAYVPSGVFRDDNSWLYAIGNYRELFIFAKTTLKYLDSIVDLFFPNSRKTTPTSKGFVLSREVAMLWCAKHLGKP